MKRTLVACAALVLLVAVGAAVLARRTSADSCAQYRFDAAAWNDLRVFRHDGDVSAREAEGSRLVGCHVLDGRRRADVLALLGRPSSGRRGRYADWIVGDDDLGDTKVLSVTFDGANVVEQVRKVGAAW